MALPSKVLATALTMLATPLAADAQTCLGLAAFAAGRVQLAASGDFGSDAKAFGASLNFGSPAGAFGGVSVGTVSYDDFDGNTTAVGGQFGWQVPVGTGNRLQLCPGGGAAYGFGPNNIEGSGADLSTFSAFFGLQLGFSTTNNPRFRIVPTAGAAFAFSRVKLENAMFPGRDETDTFGIFTLGLGFVLSTRVSIRPSVDMPVGLEDADPSFGIMVGVNF